MTVNELAQKEANRPTGETRAIIAHNELLNFIVAIDISANLELLHELIRVTINNTDYLYESSRYAFLKSALIFIQETMEEGI